MDTRAWLRHLLPLPRHIEIVDSRTCRAQAIRVDVPGSDPPGGNGVVVAEAAAALRRALAPAGTAAAATPPVGATPADTPAAVPSVGSADEASVTIELRLGVDALPGAPRLRALPHPSQSYVITCPDEARIVIAALAAPGLYYGAVTLAQLLTAARDGDRVTLPRLEVVDGPAFDERGLWNFPDPRDWIPWMAGLKLNYGKMADTRLAPVERGTPNAAAIDVDLHRRAAAMAFAYVPYIVHLNFLHDVGLYRAWPELAGVGDGALAGRYVAHKEGDPHRCPCASQPRLVDILAEWLASLAGQGADEVSCWLSERPCQCGCERCTPVGQFLLEARAFVNAWERARQSHPRLRIRVFSSTTTPAQDAAILAELPADVRFERACATTMERVRHEPRDLFRNALLDDAAAAGRWIASYDVPIGAYGNVDTPEVKVPQFGAARIRHFLGQLRQRGYAGAYGMLAWATQARTICGPAVCALAEYAWNPEGRSVGELAAAWATREGLDDADVVAAWTEILCELEFDVYDGDFPMCWTWGGAAKLVEGGQAPRLGEGMFRHFRAVDDFARKRAACARARHLVQGLPRPDLALATDVIGGYIDLAGAVFHLAHCNAHADLSQDAGRAALEDAVARFEAAAEAHVDAVLAWRQHLGPEPWHHRVHDAVAATRDTARRITAHIRQQRFS